MPDKPRTHQLDPDFSRRNAPKSGPYCARCQKPVDPKKSVAVTVDWSTWEVVEGGDEFVGGDCWKRIVGGE
jgi:hypothetical protein